MYAYMYAQYISTLLGHMCVSMFMHTCTFSFIHAQCICICVCVHCTFHIIYLSTCICLVNVHSRIEYCAWNGKCKVDNVLASVRFSAALVLVRIRVAHMCSVFVDRQNGSSFDVDSTAAYGGGGGCRRMRDAR